MLGLIINLHIQHNLALQVPGGKSRVLLSTLDRYRRLRGSPGRASVWASLTECHGSVRVAMVRERVPYLDGVTGRVGVDSGCSNSEVE